MPLNNPYAGANLLAEWQATPTPWVTSSAVPASGVAGFEFQTAAKHFRITNQDAATTLRVGFTRNGVAGNNYILVPSSGTLSLDAKFTQLWIQGTSGQQFSLFVGLTGIPQRNFGVLTGSNGFNVG
jgi:hypothetical protein